MTGISIGTVVGVQTIDETQKIWRSFQALGAIAFAYSYSLILIEIQVTQHILIFDSGLVCSSLF